MSAGLAPKQAELTWWPRRLRQSSYRRRRGRLSLVTAMVLVRSCLSRMGSVLGGANGYVPLLGGGKNCVLSAEGTEGHGEHLFVRGGHGGRGGARRTPFCPRRDTENGKNAWGVLFA